MEIISVLPFSGEGMAVTQDVTILYTMILPGFLMPNVSFAPLPLDLLMEV